MRRSILNYTRSSLIRRRQISLNHPFKIRIEKWGIAIVNGSAGDGKRKRLVAPDFRREEMRWRDIRI